MGRVTKKPPRRKSPGLADKVLEFIAAREEGKAAYARADVVADELETMLTVGVPVELPDGRTAVLVDQFADRKVVWKPAGVRRFEIKVK